MTETSLSLPDRITALLDHLGIERAHIAARMASDWQTFAAQHPTRIASLSLLCPPYIDAKALQPLADRLYVMAGDRAIFSPQIAQAMQQLPAAHYQLLHNVNTILWTDITVEFANELQETFLPFLTGQTNTAVDATKLNAGDRGEVAGITYMVYGSGAPLILFPLILAPSGWQPLLDTLQAHFCVIVLGGTELGALPVLEHRGHSAGYRRLLRNLFEEINLQTGETVLEIGCGSGVVSRWLVDHSAGNNPITALDINNYLLSEALALAEKAGMAAQLSFQNGNAEALPFPDSHFDITFATTVMEEVNADRMLAEMIRVTKPGGRVGIIIRAHDLPETINIPARPELRAKYEQRSHHDEGDACVSASLYRRFHQSALTNVVGWPQLAEFTQPNGPVERFLMSPVLGQLTPAERQEWQSAVAQAVADGTFFITWPHHCAVGTKR